MNNIKGLLVFLLVFGLFRAGTEDVYSQSGTAGPLTWRIAGGVLTISGEGAMPDYEDLENYSPPWFYRSEYITSVDIGEGVTSIGNNAFNCHTSIVSVTIPATVTTIGDLAFNACISLASVTIPSSVETIGEMALLQCHAMTSILVDAASSTFTSVDGILFSKDMKTIVACPGGRVGSYTIPESVETIAKWAFGYCTQLTSVIIPASVTAISEMTFVNCSNFTSVTIPASVKTIGKSAFQGCTKMASVTIPASVETIDEFAFHSCISLTSVTIPASVKTIGQWAFASCENLSEVVNLNITPITIPVNVFKDVDFNTCFLRVPATSVNSYQKADGWKEFKNIIALYVEITLDIEEICLLTGTTMPLTATVFGSNITEWNSNNPGVATVNNNGTITAVSPGSTVITVSASGNEATCTITVIEPGKSTIKGTINNVENESIRINLYMKGYGTDVQLPLTKKGIIGGYILLATTVPNDNGEYIFENLPEGLYKIEVEIDDYESEPSKEIPIFGNDTGSTINITVNGTGAVIFDIPTGTEDLLEAVKPIVYPNPFIDMVHIMGVVVETGHTPSLQVINTTGTVVHTQMISNPDETIWLEHLPVGMYIIRIGYNGRTTATFRVVKQ